jgi:hypothetical protein
MMTTSASQTRLRSIAIQLFRVIDGYGGKGVSEDKILSFKENLLEASFTCEETNEIIALAHEMSSMDSPPEENNPKVSSGQNFQSLWSSFTPLSDRVMWFHIEEANDETERMTLIQKVDHIDDILSDWKDANDILRQGLKNNTEKFLDLHLKWFGHCQATAEYQSIRFDLCQNILLEIRRFFGTKSFIMSENSCMIVTELKIIFKLFEAWRYMWIQIITSGAYRESDADSLMLYALVMMRNLRVSCDKAESKQVILPVHIVALVDPCADWCRCWFDETPIHRIVNVVTESCLLPDLWNRCSSHGQIDASFEEEKVGDTIILPPGNDICIHDFTSLVFQHSISMLTSLLLHLRVHMFPWDQLNVTSIPLAQSSLLYDLQERHDIDNHFPNPLPSSGSSILMMSKVILMSKNVECEWLSKQVDLTIDCLQNGCINDSTTRAELYQLVSESSDKI